jgi:outer membrane protein
LSRKLSCQKRFEDIDFSCPNRLEYAIPGLVPMAKNWYYLRMKQKAAVGIKFPSIFVIWAILTAGGCPGNAWASIELDPFETAGLTTPNPQTYWLKPPDLLVNASASYSALAQLPHQPLSLAAVTDFALRNNPDTRLAWEQAKAAAAGVGIAKSAYLPQITAGYTEEYSAVVFSEPQESQWDYGPNVSLSYLLLDFGYRSNTVRAAENAQIAANLNQNNAIQQVILQVQESYYQVLGQQALVSANVLSLKQANTSLDVAQALRHNGLATIGDVYQAEASRAQADLDLQTSQGNYQTALGQLATSMGLPANAPVKLMELHEPPKTHQIQQKVAYLLTVAKGNRPDLLAAEAKVRQSQAQLAATRASVYPTLTVDANMIPGNVFTNNEGNDTTVLFTLSMPIFTGFSYTYNVRQAQAQLRASEATRDQLVQQVEFQVWETYFALQTAERNIGTTEILLKSALQASNQAIGQYKNGVGDILTVLTTQTTLARARVQHIQAQLNWYIALAQLAAAIGTLQSSSAQDLLL